MRDNKTFVTRVSMVFILTVLTVGFIKCAVYHFGGTNTVETFILAILISQIWNGFIDPRDLRKRRATFTVAVEDIDKLKSEVRFLKYYLHKEMDVDFSELELESSIWIDLDNSEGEHNKSEVNLGRTEGQEIRDGNTE